jgi:hypothetical protein
MRGTPDQGHKNPIPNKVLRGTDLIEGDEQKSNNKTREIKAFLCVAKRNSDHKSHLREK